ncbi:MAG: glycosyltransferase family 2 protein, partial [Candidatus Omnitrophota bacterium]
MNIELTISIVNWNSREYLRQCLESIRDNVRGIGYEVIVVDNASQDNSVTMVRNDFPDTLLIGNQENLGFARGNNQAFAKSRGRYFLLLNPDTRVLSGSLEKMVEFLGGHPDAGAVAPKYLNPDGTFQRYYYRFPNSLIFPISQTLPGVLI